MSKAYKIPGTAVIHELLDDEIIIANLDSGIYYSLRESAIPLWQLLTSNYDLNKIITLFAHQYQIEDHSFSDSLRFLTDQLVSENLLIETTPENTQQENLPHLFWPTRFNPPHFEKYEEMKNLLMLDPIHEVDEQGWPHKSKA